MKKTTQQNNLYVYITVAIVNLELNIITIFDIRFVSHRMAREL